MLRCYLLAAAFGYDMGQMMEWVLAPDQPALAAILRQHPHAVPAAGWAAWRPIWPLTRENRSGYFAALAPAAVTFMDARWWLSPAARPRVSSSRSRRSCGPTARCMAGDDRRLALLLTALTEAVFATAQRLVAASGRLDPPMSMFLDEIAQITPVASDRWAADSRGCGVTIYAVLQDLCQAQARSGRSRAQTIFATLPTKVVLQGERNIPWEATGLGLWIGCVGEPSGRPVRSTVPHRLRTMVVC